MKINEIINNEIVNYINEGVIEDDRFKFIDRFNINDVEFNNYESINTEHDINFINADISINWYLNFWVNQQGLENITPIIDGFNGMFVIESRDKISDEKINQTQKDINDYDWKPVIGEYIINKNDGLYISKLSFDFKNKTCIINF